MLGYGVNISDSIKEIQAKEEERKRKALPPISEAADIILAARDTRQEIDSLQGSPGENPLVQPNRGDLPPISEAADLLLSLRNVSSEKSVLPPISQAADLILAARDQKAQQAAPAQPMGIDRSDHGNNAPISLGEVPGTLQDPLHLGAAAQNAYWNLRENHGNVDAMRAYLLDNALRTDDPAAVVAANRSGIPAMSPGEEAARLREIAAVNRGDSSEAGRLEQDLQYRVDELKENAKRLWSAAEKGRVKYDIPDNKFGAAILNTIESSGMTVEAALRSGLLWAAGGPVLGMLGSALNTATEADYEAGETFINALKAGKSPEEIQNAVNSVRIKNLALLSLTNPLGDVLLFGMGKPLKALASKIPGKGLLAKAGKSLLERGVPYVAQSFPEGVEGGSQEAFQQQAAGKPLDLGKITEAAGSEALASLLYGFAGRGVRGAANVLFNGEGAKAENGTDVKPPAAEAAPGRYESPDAERVKLKLLEIREKIVTMATDAGTPTLSWERLPDLLKKKLVTLRTGMKLWDAGEFQEAEKLADRVKDELMPDKDTPLWNPVEETAPASDTSGTTTDTSTPRERVKGKIRGQLEGIAAQGGEQGKVLGSDEIDAYSTLFAAMAEQAGKRQGISAEEWLENQNLKIVNGSPQFEASGEGIKLNQPLNDGVDPESSMTGFVAQPRFTENSVRNFIHGTGRKDFERSLAGTHVNDDTGWSLLLSQGNVDHAIASALKNKEVDIATSMNILAELPKVIKHARLIETHDDMKANRNVEKIHRFFAPSRIGNDDALYKIKLTVKQMKEGNVLSVEGIYRAYDTKVIEKVPERLPRGDLSKGMSNDNTPGTFEIILGPFLEGVNDSEGKPYVRRDGEKIVRANEGENRDQGNASTLADTTFQQNEGTLAQDSMGKKGEARGSILFSYRGRRIRLGQKMDRSTLVHEFGHLFLRDLELSSANNDPSSVRDYQILKNWWKKQASWLASWIRNSKSLPENVRAMFTGHKGVELVQSALDGTADSEATKAVGIACHEMFARGFERYLSEGKSPSAALQGVFQRFKSWISQVYGQMAGNPNFKLSDEARQVMAGMVGGETVPQGPVPNVSVTSGTQGAEISLKDDLEYEAPPGAEEDGNAKKVSERRRRKGQEDLPLNGHTQDTFERILDSFPEGVNDSEGKPYVQRDEDEISRADEEEPDNSVEFEQDSNVKRQQALTHKGEERDRARNMGNGPESPWSEEGSNVSEEDIDDTFSDGASSFEGFSKAARKFDRAFDPKNTQEYDKEGNLLSEEKKDEDYLNPIFQIASPSVVAKRSPAFAPFFKMGKDAMELQETLRRDYNRILDKAWNALSEDQTIRLNELLIEGDLRGKTYTDEQLTARGFDEQIRAGYRLIRDLSDRVGKAVRIRQRESGMKVMGWREGYVPHIFHGFWVRMNGRIVDTARSLQEAIDLAAEVEKKYPGGKVDIQSKPSDFSGTSAYNISALNDKKLLSFSATMEEAFTFTRKEAQNYLRGKDNGAFKNRIFAFSKERLGIKGWDQDMKFAFRHYMNQSARFLAMDELKSRGIDLFERTFGNFKHEHKGVARYAKYYLNDVLGVPSEASRMMNEFIKRIPGMYKISKQVFGDRPAEYLASVFTKGMGVAKLGFLNMASAMMNLSQLINTSALLGYGEMGHGIRAYFGNLTNPSQRVQQIYEETGVLGNLNISAGAGYSKASEKIYGALGKFLELSMAPFAIMDGMARKATVIAAYEKAHREGKNHKEAIAYAKEINDRANFDYSVADTPAFLRRTGPLGQVLFQFKKFGIKQFELAIGLNGFAENARFWIPMIALSGLWGFPGSELLKGLFRALFDKDPQAEVNAWMAKQSWLSEPVRRTIQYGLLSNAGIDVSKRVGMGDVIPNEMADLLGPTLGTISRMAAPVGTLAGKLVGMEGDGTAALLNALEALSPGLSNPIKAVLGEVEDKRRGRLRFKYEGAERIVRGMGFRPTREAVESDAIRTVNYVEQQRMDRERKAIDAYVRAREAGDTKAAAEALRRVKELKITPDRIIRELRERKKGTAYERLEQKMRGPKRREGREVMQGFQG